MAHLQKSLKEREIVKTLAQPESVEGVTWFCPLFRENALWFYRHFCTFTTKTAKLWTVHPPRWHA